MAGLAALSTAALSAAALSAAALSAAPLVPLPYTTTMLRTHNFGPAAEFLSIGEQLSVKGLNYSGPSDNANYEEAYSIFPPTPFSMRDANHTVVRGIRAVYRYAGHGGVAATKETFYFLTGLDGQERCVKHAKQALLPPPPAASIDVGASLRGGIGVATWVVADAAGAGGSTTTAYANETRGDPAASGPGEAVHYPFRISVVHPPGGPEYGYVLDHGQHFPVDVPAFHATDGCPPLAATPPLSLAAAATAALPHPYLDISQAIDEAVGGSSH